jgi:hypothetical protein
MHILNGNIQALIILLKEYPQVLKLLLYCNKEFFICYFNHGWKQIESWPFTTFFGMDYNLRYLNGTIISSSSDYIKDFPFRTLSHNFSVLDTVGDGFCGYHAIKQAAFINGIDFNVNYSSHPTWVNIIEICRFVLENHIPMNIVAIYTEIDKSNEVDVYYYNDKFKTVYLYNHSGNHWSTLTLSTSGFKIRNLFINDLSITINNSIAKKPLMLKKTIIYNTALMLKKVQFKGLMFSELNAFLEKHDNLNDKIEVCNSIVNGMPKKSSLYLKAMEFINVNLPESGELNRDQNQELMDAASLSIDSLKKFITNF